MWLVVIYSKYIARFSHTLPVGCNLIDTVYRALCRWTKKTGLFYSHVTPLVHHLLMTVCVRERVQERERERDLFLCTVLFLIFATNQEVANWRVYMHIVFEGKKKSLFLGGGGLLKLTITLRHNGKCPQCPQWTGKTMHFHAVHSWWKTDVIYLSSCRAIIPCFSVTRTWQTAILVKQVRGDMVLL